jgi:CRISPR-associated protein Cmr1
MERTLRAWILFGGIGSRTRRGCGSVTVQEEKRAKWLPRELSLAALHQLLGTQVFASGTHKATDMPSLRGATLLFREKESQRGENAWTDALEWLRDFRQKPGPEGDHSDGYARGPIRKKLLPNRKRIERPGRSRWPEPDKVRQLLARSRSHRWAHRPEHNERPVWPRASFGLPIVGRFQDKDIHGQKYDPRDPDEFELCWQDASGPHDRLASPLIVKALPLAGGKYAPIALWLERAYPANGDVVLRRKRKIVKGSTAPFDRLHADGDPELYAPLRGFKSNMKEAFTKWLETEHGLTRLGGEDA